MANVIQIKHGAGNPNGKLAPYELGYVTDTGYLYIGGQMKANEEDKTLQYGDAQEIKVSFSSFCENAVNAANAEFATTANTANFATTASMANTASLATTATTADTADTAKKLEILDMGNATKPVYFSDGIPVECKTFVSAEDGGAFSGPITVLSLIGTKNETWGTDFPTTNLTDGRIFFKIM